MDEIDFEADKFEDIISRDARYDARAYALLCEVLRVLGENDNDFSGEDVLEEFKEFALDQYGPLTYTVLTEWGLSSTEDIGEMMFNLVDSHRIGKGEKGSREDFIGGYDFKETFLDPYQ